MKLVLQIVGFPLRFVVLLGFCLVWLVVGLFLPSNVDIDWRAARNLLMGVEP